MNTVTTRLGGLTCRLVDALPAGARPEYTVVLCHGYGAPGTDLVPLAGAMLRMAPALAHRIRFVFPEAPELLVPWGDMRAWWQIDVARIEQLRAAGQLRDTRGERPPGLGPARRKLRAAIEALGVAPDRLVLGGFSQGSMLTTDLALRLEEAPAALLIFSGALINEEEWRRLADRRRGLRVLQSHGRQDPVLPYQTAEWLRELLSGAGLELEFLPFDGPHTISHGGLARAAALLSELPT